MRGGNGGNYRGGPGQKNGSADTVLSGDIAQAAANSTATGPTSCTAETDSATESNASAEHTRE